MPISRRGLLKSGTVGLTTASIPALGGCLGGPGTPREDGRYPYASWVYDPRTVGDSSHGSFYALDLAAVAAHEGAFRQPTYAKYRNYVDLLDIGFLNVDSGAIDGVLQLYPLAGGSVQGVVLTGEYRPERLEATLARDFEERARYREFDVFWNAVHHEVAVAIADGHVLLGNPTSTHSTRDVVQALIDAKDGTGDRYAEASPAFGFLTERLGSGHDVSGFTHPLRSESAPSRGVFENEVARGHRYTFGRRTSRSRYAFVFASEDDVDLEAVRAWVDANDDADDRLFGAYEAITVSRTGRAAVVDGTVPTSVI